MIEFLIYDNIIDEVVLIKMKTLSFILEWTHYQWETNLVIQ